MSCTQGMQLPRNVVHHPLCTRAHSGDYDNGGGDDDANGRCSAVDQLPRIVGTQQCTVDMNNIDPVLLMEAGGYSPFALVGPTRTAADDAEADMDSGTGGSEGDSRSGEPSPVSPHSQPR